MYNINSDISRAETLPTSFYTDEFQFKASTDKLFSESWQLIGDVKSIFAENNLVPITLVEGVMDEPILLVKTKDDDIKCLSNVCTHRGNILVDKPKKSGQILCGYHGRRFDLNGSYEFMPEFEKVKDFPRACEDLHNIKLKTWHQFIFINLKPVFDFNLIENALEERVGFLDISKFKKDDSLGKNYIVNAHWALYCDNFLEGFHIPFVHPGLNQAVEYQSYKTVLYDYCNLQIAYAKQGVESFDFPPDHLDYGKEIAAYYYWIFPNLMLNFYPWGLSVNIIKPLAHNRTEVQFISYVGDSSKIDQSAGAELNSVELEDEEVVQNVQQGIKSRFYSTGRFSPTREQGVHHFHRLIAETLNR